MHEQHQYCLTFRICDKLHLVYTEDVITLVFLQKTNKKNYYIMVLILFGNKMLKKKEKANKKIKTLSELMKNKV